MLIWIVWNRSFYLYKNGFSIIWPTIFDMPSNPNKQTNKQTNKNNILFGIDFSLHTVKWFQEFLCNLNNSIINHIFAHI